MNYKSRIPATIVAALTRRAFLICALCSLTIVPSSASSANANRSFPAIPMAVYDTFSFSTKTPPEGYDVSFEGVFTSIIGREVQSGKSRMDVKVLTRDADGNPDLVHCKFTWVCSVGTLVLKSVCVISDGHGTWHIADGTGRYKNFKGIGTETFGPLPAGGPFTDYERFAGIVTNDKHDD